MFKNILSNYLALEKLPIKSRQCKKIFVAKIHSRLNLRFKFFKTFPYQYFHEYYLESCTTLIVIVAHISASSHLGAHFVHTWSVSTSVERYLVGPTGIPSHLLVNGEWMFDSESYGPIKFQLPLLTDILCTWPADI